jgi:uncharacterized protein (DUF885 family)
LVGLAAFALCPRRASASPTLRSLLDRAAALPDPAQAADGLEAEPPASLGRSDAAILRMVEKGLRRDLALRSVFPFGKGDGSSPYVVSHRHGAWLELETKAGPGLASRLDEETARLRGEAAQGIVPPAFMVARILEAERRLLAKTGAEIRPALARQIQTLEALPNRHEEGIWNLKHGAEYYALRLRCTSGSELSPTRLDRLVLAETRQLLARADRLFRGLGLDKGSVGARYRALKCRPGDAYSNDGASRDRAVADMNHALDRLRPRLATWFNPPLELRSSVRRMTPVDERASKRGYRDAPGDGRPGVYFPDLASPPDRPRWTLVTVAHHEALPGHMLQFRRQFLANPHPLQLRYAAGYSEGWAIYAESLVDRIGLLSPVEQLGFIQSVLFRLARVTADIGIHFHRWDRARAIHYLQETVGFELFFPFDVEVDRYCAEPAGFAGDALSAITLRRLGAARMKRGPAAMRSFHDAALNHGPLNVEGLETVTA